MSVQHEIATITLRHVTEEALARREKGRDYLPWCRGTKHGHDIGYPDWNVRFSYKTHSVRGGGVSFWWCDKCLPSKYTKVALSMLRGKETTRIIKGKALAAVVAPKRLADGGRMLPTMYLTAGCNE